VLAGFDPARRRTNCYDYQHLLSYHYHYYHSTRSAPSPPLHHRPLLGPSPTIVTCNYHYCYHHHQHRRCCCPCSGLSLPIYQPCCLWLPPCVKTRRLSAYLANPIECWTVPRISPQNHREAILRRQPRQRRPRFSASLPALVSIIATAQYSPCRVLLITRSCESTCPLSTLSTQPRSKICSEWSVLPCSRSQTLAAERSLTVP
jgi:hypothetical protein